MVAEIVGVPPEDFARFQSWAQAINGFVDAPEKGMRAAAELTAYLRPHLEARRHDPKDDLITKLVAAEVDGERLTDEEIVSFLRLLLPAGSETTYRGLGNVLFALLTHPAALDAVRADGSKIPQAIEEALRWEPPAAMVSRCATEPTSMAGVAIPSGAQVACCIGSANRDETHYPDLDRFDLERHPDDHLTFGLGTAPLPGGAPCASRDADRDRSDPRALSGSSARPDGTVPRRGARLPLAEPPPGPARPGALICWKTAATR